jgi:hypothetical protein
MQRWKRLIAFLLLNVVVTALTMWVVLALWTRANPLPGGVAESPAAPAAPAGTGSGAGAPPGAAPTGVSASAGQMEISLVIAAGDLSGERVQLRHIGTQEISLAGWQLKDEDGAAFVFPALRMFSGGAVTVYTRAGVNTVVELYWGLDQPAWSSGETVTLLDPDGNAQATYIIP